MTKYDCTLYGIRTRAENRRARETTRERELAKYESIHKIPVENPVENRNEIQVENGAGIELIFLQEIIVVFLFYACIYLYWFVN